LINTQIKYLVIIARY